MADRIGTLATFLTVDGSGLAKGLGVAKTQIGAFAKGVQGIFTNMTGANLFAGLATGGGWVAFFTHGIELTRQMSREVKQLELAFRNSGNAAGITTAEVKATADRLAGLGVSRTETLGSAQTLAQFSQVQGNTYRRALELAPNMAAMTGGTSQEAASQLAHFLQDPARGLARLTREGLLSQEEQRSIRKPLDTGDLEGARGRILDALESRYRGAVEALVTPGQKLHAAFDELAMTSGAKLIPVLSAVTSGLLELRGQLPKMDRAEMNRDYVLKQMAANLFEHNTPVGKGQPGSYTYEAAQWRSVLTADSFARKKLEEAQRSADAEKKSAALAAANKTAEDAKSLGISADVLREFRVAVDDADNKLNGFSNAIGEAVGKLRDPLDELGKESTIFGAALKEGAIGQQRYNDLMLDVTRRRHQLEDQQAELRDPTRNATHSLWRDLIYGRVGGERPGSLDALQGQQERARGRRFSERDFQHVPRGDNEKLLALEKQVDAQNLRASARDMARDIRESMDPLADFKHKVSEIQEAVQFGGMTRGEGASALDYLRTKHPLEPEHYGFAEVAQQGSQAAYQAIAQHTYGDLMNPQTELDRKRNDLLTQAVAALQRLPAELAAAGPLPGDEF